MSAIRSSARKGFTLVEILIVVIILGILAAIVIPQFTNASQNARISSLQSTLQTLRSQVELFKLQHGDTLPNLVTDWTPFTTASVWPAGSTTSFGPYMQAIPVNSLTGLSNVVDAGVNLAGATPATLAGITTAAAGFVYDYNSGSGSGLIYGTGGTDGQTNTAIAGVGAGAAFSAY